MVMELAQRWPMADGAGAVTLMVRSNSPARGPPIFTRHCERIVSIPYPVIAREEKQSMLSCDGCHGSLRSSR
jgi:hypothetical protein